MLIEGRNLRGEGKNGQIITSVMPEGTDIVEVLNSNDVQYRSQPRKQWNAKLLIYLAVLVSYALIHRNLDFFMRQMQGGSRGAMGFGKSRAKLLTEHQNGSSHF